jgi:hypothetical protein
MQPTQQIRTLIRKLLEYHFLFADIPGSVSQFNIRKGVLNRYRGQTLYKVLSTDLSAINLK